MAKQNINVGTTANDKKGDSLRAAFQKVNANFTELYTELGLVNDVTLSLGAFEFAGSTISTTDSTAIVIDQATTVTSNLTVGGDIVPQTAHGGDLGSSTLPWRSLYVSNNTIYIGGVALSLDAGGNLTVNGSRVGATSYADLSGKPALTTVATTGAYADLTGKPTIPTLVSQLSNDSGFLTSVGNISNIQSEGDINIEVNLTDSTLRRWRFGEDGNLTLPSGGNISEGGGLSGAIRLTPSGGANANQALLIYPTGFAEGDHIHLTAGGGSTELYLGDDDHYVKLASNGFVVIKADDGVNGKVWGFSPDGTTSIPGDIKSDSNINIEINLSDSTLRRWQFGEDGELTLPAGGNISEGSIPGGTLTGNTIVLTPNGGTSATQQLLVYPTTGPDANHLHLTSGDLTTTELFLGNDDQYVKLASDGNVSIQADDGLFTAAAWTFGFDGSLTIPGDIRSEGNINIDINLADSTLRRWQFGEDGKLTFPDGANYAGQTVTMPTTFGNTTNSFVWEFSDIALGTDRITLNWNLLASDTAGFYIGTTHSTTGKYLFLDGTDQSLSYIAGDGLFGGGKLIFGSSAGNNAGDANAIEIKATNGDVYLTSTESVKITVDAADSSARIWTFDPTGELTFPDNTISTGKGITVPVNESLTVNLPYTAFDGGTHTFKINPQSIKLPNGNGVIFAGDETAANEWNLDSGNKVLSFPDAGDGVYPKILYSDPNNNGIGMELLTFAKSIKITAESNKSWTFGTDGSLTLPGDIKSNGNINIEVNLTDSTLRRWQFGEDGILTLPSVGKINNGEYDWTFGTDGSLTVPGSITLTNGAVIKDTAGDAVAFGQGAGTTSQGTHAVAIGKDAGAITQGNQAVAIGINAGVTTQGNNSVAIGPGAGATTQGTEAVAIGTGAGEITQGQSAVAIGYNAGLTAQAANSIILNATGETLNQTTANTFTVAPIRNISATSGVLQYNASTKEISYNLNVTAETFNTDQITVVGNRITTTVTNANLELECNGTGGVVINTVADATTASTVKSVGYLGLPQSATATTATLAIGDAGKHIYITTTGQTITIPAASSVAYPIGTTLTFIAGPSATTATIAITTDTLRLAGGTSTGSRTLAANGMATAVKVSGTSSAGVWYINGVGLT